MTNACQFSSFTELPEGARRLFEDAAEESFFQGLPWFQTFVKHALDSGDQVRIYCAGGSNPYGAPQMALATVHKAADSGFWKMRKLSSLSSYYSCLFGPAWKASSCQQAAEELASALAGDSPRWDAIELKPLDPKDPVFQALAKGLRRAGFVVQEYFCFGNWYLTVNGRSFVQYLDSLPSPLKHTLNRKKRKLEKSGRAKLEIITGGEGLETAIQAYNRVYLASWKEPEPYPEFVPELMRVCAAIGALRLGLLCVDGEPAAAQFWIVMNGRALIYKLAYDERFSDLSVGTILTAALMQRAIDEDKVTEVDYLSGDDPYKKDWMSARRERWGILAMNPLTFRGALAIARHVGGRAAKRALLSLAGRGRKQSVAPSLSKASSNALNENFS
jgi:Acetyltransferase (GNAT) domain